MELKAGSIRIKHHYFATFVTSWKINACQVALPLCTNEGGFYEGYLKAPCLWLSTAVPFHCSHIHDDTQQTQRPEDRGQRTVFTVHMFVVHEVRHESRNWVNFPNFCHATFRYQDRTNGFLRHLSCSVGKRWPMTTTISFCLRGLYDRPSLPIKEWKNIKT